MRCMITASGWASATSAMLTPAHLAISICSALGQCHLPIMAASRRARHHIAPQRAGGSA